MSQCKKTSGPCNCGRLFLYDRFGRAQTLNTGASCLTDGEIRNALSVMLQEWRRRCSTAEQARAHMH